MILLAILLGLLHAVPASAELASLFGTGPVSQAMGGVAVVQGQANPYQAYSAPAALGYLRRVELSLGALYLDPHLKPFGTLVISSNGTLAEFRESGVLPGGGNTLGFALPLGKVRPLTLGGAFYIPFSSLVRVSGSPVDYPFYPLYTDLSRNFSFVVGAGYEFVDGWALGLNVRSTTKSKASYLLRTDSTVNYSATAVEARSESRLSYSILYDNARRHKDGSPWTAGFMYRGHAGMETKLSADVTAFVPVQGVLVSLPAYTPAEWVLMGSLQPLEWWKLSGEVARVEWSKFTSPYGSGNINSYVITNSPANFHDITVFRFGMQQQFPVEGKLVRKISYREGYQFHPTPVPDQNSDSNFVDSTRHMFSAGLGLGFVSPWEEKDTLDLDLFFQYNLLNKRSIAKNSSRNVGAPGYEAGGNILIFGGAASVKF
ncbi:MAG TPA: outer membrane protein transport protein [Bdellovibrionota bacterium]|jgi:hypothetical protein